MPTYTTQILYMLLVVFSIIFSVFIFNFILYVPVVIKNRRLQKDLELRLEEFRNDIYGTKNSK